MKLSYIRKHLCGDNNMLMNQQLNNLRLDTERHKGKSSESWLEV